DCALSIADGFGSVDADVAYCNDVFGPALQPSQKQLCGILGWLFGRCFGWVAARQSQSLEEVCHDRHPSGRVKPGTDRAGVASMVLASSGPGRIALSNTSL